MEKHNKEKFDEPALVEKLGMEYISIPVGGSAGRASCLWVAYVIKYRGMSVGDAMTVGERINFRFLLEDLLGYSLSITSE